LIREDLRLDPPALAEEDSVMPSPDNMFTDIPMSADDAEAIVAALRDIAETDGVHDEELALINEFVQTLDQDLGEEKPTELPKMTPELLASTLTDPTLRTVAVQSAVLIAMADGNISDKERAKCKEYADALGVTGEMFQAIETAIVEWVKSGDLASIME
jgi:tellurite resistance protein